MNAKELKKKLRAETTSPHPVDEEITAFGGWLDGVKGLPKEIDPELNGRRGGYAMFYGYLSLLPEEKLMLLWALYKMQ